jgi:hypothetical protein
MNERNDASDNVHDCGDRFSLIYRSGRIAARHV